MSKNNFIPTMEKVHRKKLCKSKKGWIVLGMTTATVAGLAFPGQITANADTQETNSDHEQSVAGTTARTSDQLTTNSNESAGRSTSNGDGYSVEVDHSDLDSAVEKAKSAGVEVTQGETTTSTIESDKAGEEVTKISSDYDSQKQNVEEATSKQEAKNNAYANDSADAAATNASNKSEIDKAVSDLQSAGGKAEHDASKDTTTKSTIDNYASSKEKVSSETKKTLDTLKNATEKVVANNKVTSSASNTDALDTAVNNAKNVLGNDNVNEESAVNRGVIKPSNANDIAKEITSDYLQQATILDKTVQNYKDAVDAAGAINRSELENAVKNAQSTLGNANVKQDATVEKTTTVGNVGATVDEVNREYKKQADDISQKVDAYKYKYDKYQKELDAYRATLNKDQIDSNAIIQSLLLKSEPNAQVTFDNKSNLTYKGKIDNYHTFELVSGNDISGTVSVTYDNLENSFYGNKKIKKIVAVFSNANTDFQKISNRDTASLNTIQDPTLGFWYNGIEGIDVDYTFYDVDGNLIDFSNDKLTGAGAWITLGSLNSGSGRIEKVKLLSTGKAYGFKNSSVSIHSGNELYSEKTNSIALKQGEDPLASNTNWIDREATDFPWGNEEWDAGLENEHAYYGAGVLNVTGKDIKLRFSTTRNYNLEGVNSGTWATISTTIVKDDSGIKTPEKPTVNYHFNSVTVEKPTVSYHYNTATPSSIDPNVKYSYSSLEVEKPEAEKVSYNYKNLNVLHKAEKTDSNIVDNQTNIIDGKNIVVGDKLAYSITTNALQASNGDSIAKREPVKSYIIKDKIPEGISVDKEKITVTRLDTSADVTNGFNISLDNENNLTVTANLGMLSVMSSDLTETFPKLTLNIPGTATKSGIELANTAHTYINGVETTTNTVVNKTTKAEPTKKVEVAGEDANGKNTITNDLQTYTVNIDYSKYVNLDISDNIGNSEVSFTDTMTDDNNVVTIDPNSFTLYDENGNIVSGLTKEITQLDDGYQIKYSTKDGKGFIRQYGGQILKLKYQAKVNDDASGTVKNTIVQNNFGVEYAGNTTSVNVVETHPKKDIVAEIGSNDSLDGQTIPLGSTIYYKLSSRELPGNRATIIDTSSFSDPFDEKVQPTGTVTFISNNDLVDADGNTVIKTNDDISKYLTVNLADGIYTLTPTDEYNNLVNLSANRLNKNSYTVYLGGKVVAAGWEYNTATENVNGDIDKTNTVKTFSYDPVTPKPTKDVSVGIVTEISASVNGSVVAPGDTVTFELKGQSLGKYHEPIKSFSLTDTFDTGITYLGYKAFISKTDENGNIVKVDVTEHLKEQRNQNTVIWIADETLTSMMNSDEYNTQIGETPTVYAYAKVDADKAETIDNSYFVTLNDKQGQSNTVEIKSVTPNPTKKDLNQSGIDINGKTVLPGSVNVYTLLWDLGKYKDVKASSDAVSKGFYYLDDYPEDVLNANPSLFTFKDAFGNNVSGITATIYDSVSESPENVQQIVKENNLSINGAFVWFSVDNPKDFYENYVQKGNYITISAPMSVREDAENGKTYSNVAYEIDFGQAYKTDVVTNNISRPEPTKDVIKSIDNQTSLDNQNIEIGQVFPYKLVGGVIPQGSSELTEYGFIDDYDESHDEFNGVYLVYSPEDITLKDGTVIEKGTELSKYTTFKLDTDKGQIEIFFNKEFLDQVDLDKGSFSATALLMMTRIASGDVENKYTNVVNGVSYVSNTVTTHTSLPDPKTPTPEDPEQSTVSHTPESSEAPNVMKNSIEKETKNIPVLSETSLPQTGNDDDKILAELGMSVIALAGGLGLAGTRKNKKA